jgi:CRISPR-associated protein Cas2
MEYQEFDNYFEYDAELQTEKRKYLVVVIYDVVDNKRRSKLAKYLKSFGFRIQRSAFECVLDKKNYDKLVGGIDKYISNEDLLRIYRLTGYADIKLWGSVDEVDFEEVIII